MKQKITITNTNFRDFLRVNAQMYKFELQKTIHARKTLCLMLCKKEYFK